MATPKKTPKKVHTKTEELPMGIVVNNSGKYRATSGSKQTRTQLSFSTLREAVAWKTASDDHLEKHGRTLSRKEWDARADGPTTGVVLDRVVVRSFLPEAIAHLAAQQHEPSSLRSDGNILLRFFEEKGALDEFVDSINGTIAEELPSWLHTENYSKDHQRAILALARNLWIRAQNCDHATRNPFVGCKVLTLDLPDTDRNGNPRTHRAAAWAPETLVAIAALLRPVYVVAFWLAACVGLRRSEITGLRLKDWNPEINELAIQRQRKKSPGKKASRPKTTASHRPLPVGQAVASMLNTYIEAAHPPCPDDDDGRTQWGERYLIVGAKGGPINPQSFCKAVKVACADLGLTWTSAGRFDPIHHLRVTFSGVAQRLAGVSPKAVSVYLGHKVPGARSEDAAAHTTRAFYTPMFAGDLEQVASEFNNWLEMALLPPLDGDLLCATPLSDAVTIEEAARMLSTGGTAHTVDDLLALVRGGFLQAEKVSHTGPLAKRTILVSAADVNAVLASIIREDADTYSAAEAAALLGTDHQGLYQLAAEGKLVEMPSNPRRRVSAPGYCTGGLPGGGRRFDKQTVDAYAKADADNIHRRKHWLTISQAAALLGQSPDTVRRAVDRGVYESWRDPRTTQRRRYINPASISAAVAAKATLSYTDAADALGVRPAEVRALVKVGVLDPSPIQGHVLESSVHTAAVTAGGLRRAGRSPPWSDHHRERDLEPAAGSRAVRRRTPSTWPPSADLPRNRRPAATRPSVMAAAQRPPSQTELGQWR